MGKLTKSQLMDKLAEVNDMSKKEVVAFMENFVSLAYEEVKGNGEFIIPGIGKMVKAHRKARMGRNPATGESIQIQAKTVVKFRLAKAAKDAVLYIIVIFKINPVFIYKHWVFVLYSYILFTNIKYESRK